MPAYLALIAAVLSRLYPHAMHGIGLNVTAVGGSLLFFGSRRPRREILIAALVLAATDGYLTTAVFRFPFHLRDYALTWLWYAAVPLLGRLLFRSSSDSADRRRPLFLRSVTAIMVTSTSFYLVSNFAVWALGSLYPHTVAGLDACFLAALPFFRNDFAATAGTVLFLFGLPELARRLVPQTAVPGDPA